MNDDASKLNKSKAISNLFPDGCLACRHAVPKRGISKKYWKGLSGEKEETCALMLLALSKMGIIKKY